MLAPCSAPAPARKRLVAAPHPQPMLVLPAEAQPERPRSASLRPKSQRANAGVARRGARRSPKRKPEAKDQGTRGSLKGVPKPGARIAHQGPKHERKRTWARHQGRLVAIVLPLTDKPRVGSWTGRASAPAISEGRGALHPDRPSGPKIRGGGQAQAEFGSRTAAGEGLGHTMPGLAHVQTRAAIRGHTEGRDSRDKPRSRGRSTSAHALSSAISFPIQAVPCSLLSGSPLLNDAEST